MAREAEPAFAITTRASITAGDTQIAKELVIAAIERSSVFQRLAKRNAAKAARKTHSKRTREAAQGMPPPASNATFASMLYLDVYGPLPRQYIFENNAKTSDVAC